MEIGATVILKTDRYNYPPNPIRVGDKGKIVTIFNLISSRRPYQVKVGNRYLMLSKDDIALDGKYLGLMRWLSAN